MLLERRLILMLDQTYINTGKYLTRNEFLDYLIKRRYRFWKYRFIWWYFFKKEKFKRKVDRALGDCIHGDMTHFGGGAPIGYNRGNKDHRYNVPLSVTEYGRRFIKWPRFISLMAVEHKGLAPVYSGGIGGVIVAVTLPFAKFLYELFT